MSYIQLIILSIIEGLTEFLPVSSTAHLMIASKLINLETTPFTELFFDAIQIGAISAVVVEYFRLFTRDIKIYYLLFMAFLPTAIIGILFSSVIRSYFESITYMAVALIIGGIVFIFIDKIISKKNIKKHKISYKDAFIIGLIQSLALIPGVSRSGSSIVGGLIRNLDKPLAVRFSFLLGVPSIFAATCKKMYDTYKINPDIIFNHDNIIKITIGNIISFIIAYFVISKFISYISKNSFITLGYYRIALGAVLLILYSVNFI